MKKFLIALLAVLSAACFLFAAACDGDRTEQPADDGAAEEGSALRYQETEDGLAVLGLEEGCTDTTVVIPASHDGKPVTEIGTMAFFCE